MHEVRWSRLALLALVLGTAGCSGEAVAGGERNVDVDATGDGSPSSPARLPSGARLALTGVVQGTVQFAASTRLVGPGGAVAVGGTPTVQVRADGGDTVRVAQGSVPGGGYTAARVVFRQVSADVTGGLVIGGGGLTGTITVDIPAGDSIVVERAISVPSGSGDVRLLVDLNAATWLATSSLTRHVTAAAFQSAVQVEVR